MLLSSDSCSSVQIRRRLSDSKTCLRWASEGTDADVAESVEGAAEEEEESKLLRTVRVVGPKISESISLSVQ